MAIVLQRYKDTSESLQLMQKLLKQREKDNAYAREYMNRRNAKKREESLLAGVPPKKIGRPKKCPSPERDAEPVEK